MIRIFSWFLVWIFTLGMLCVKVKYTDGVEIEFHSWIKCNHKKGQ